jgi:histidinol-phosphatase (PHP family)
MINDYHVHTPLCKHASGRVEDYVKAAEERGLSELGFSDHAPLPVLFDDWRMDWAELELYQQWLETGRAVAQKVKIRAGLEVDFFKVPPKGQPENLLEQIVHCGKWDYLIGSVHYIGNQGSEVAVDDPRHLSRWQSETDVLWMWQEYWSAYEACIRSGYFDFCAHPDLAKRFKLRPKGDLKRYYEPVIQAFAEKDVVMEVSTAGWRKDVREIYPHREMIELAFAAGVKIILNSDAHDPLEVGYEYTKALELLKEVGYTKTVVFENHQKHLVDLG